MTQADQRTTENPQQMTRVGFPFGVIRSPSTEISLRAGETFTLSVTVANEGNQSVILDLSIEDTGEENLGKWCLSPHTSIAIGINQSHEVIFKFPIPLDAVPQFYAYTLKLDSPRHYQDQLPVFYPGTLQVLAPIEQSKDLDDPSFTIHPLTDSKNPLEVRGGELIPFVITIYNRSHQVDRFYLNCNDLPEDWFKVIYPEMATQGGIITSSSGLELNPEQSGHIQFHLTLPTTSKAGRISPTLRVYSANYGENLVLLDLIHLKVPELHQLEIQLITQVGTVINQRGWYEIQLHNRGNTTRQLQLDIIDTEGDHLCQYFLERSLVEIHPLEQILVNLYIDPPPAWQRPFTGRAFNFTLKIRDLQGIFLPIAELPGVLLWKARPLWHLYLLIIAILLLLGGLIGLTWWLLTKKPPLPEVISFTPQNTLYNAIDNQAIRLNWQIQEPKQLAQLQLKGVSPEGKVISQPISYDFSQGIPASLQEFCTLGKTLLCTNVPTDAFQAGDYQFQLILITQGESLQALPPVTTPIISILPIPKPSLSEFTAASSTYQEGVQGGIKLNWKVENFRFLKQLQLSVRSINSQKPLKTLIPSFVFQPQEANPIPPFLQPYCQAINKQLVCYDVPTPINQVGKFVFQLTLDPLYNPPHSSVSVPTLPIEVKAKPIPIDIVRFEIDGSPAPPIYRVNLAEKSFVSLLWQVKGSKTLQVDLVPVPGTVQPSGGLVYRLSAEPKTETIILSAIDAQGQKQSRSVMIETYLPPSPSSTNQGGIGIPGQPGQQGEDSTTSDPKTGQTSKGSSNTNTDTQSTQTTEKEKELLEPPSPPMTNDPQFR